MPIASEYKKAISAFNRVIENRDNHAGAFFGRGMANYHIAGDLAVEDLETAIKLCQESFADFDKAIDLYKGSVEFFYGRAMAKRRMGELYSYASKPEKIKKLYEEALEDFNNSIKVYSSDKHDLVEKINALLNRSVTHHVIAPILLDKSGAYSKQDIDISKQCFAAALQDINEADECARSGECADHHYLRSQIYLNRALVNISKLNFLESVEKKKMHENIFEDLTKAIKCSDEIDGTNPNLLTLYLKRAEINFVRDEPNAALSDYCKVTQIAPHFSKAYYQLAYLYLQENSYQKALDNINSYIRLAPNDAAAYTTKGAILTTIGRYKEGVKEFNRAIKLNPKYFLAYYNLANEKVRVNEFHDAIKLYDKADNLIPDTFQCLINRAKAKLMAKDFQGALADYDKALNNSAATERHKPLILLSKASANLFLRNLNESLADIDQALNLGRYFPPAYFMRGNVNSELQNFKESIKDFNRAIELDPYNHKYYTNRGTAHVFSEKFDEAVNDYSAALRLNRKDYLALVGRGSAYIIQGKFYESIADFDHALRLIKSIPAAHEGRALAMSMIANTEEEEISLQAAKKIYAGQNEQIEDARLIHESALTKLSPPEHRATAEAVTKWMALSIRGTPDEFFQNVA